jgi:hypothetical protein
MTNRRLFVVPLHICVTSKCKAACKSQKYVLGKCVYLFHIGVHLSTSICWQSENVSILLQRWLEIGVSVIRFNEMNCTLLLGYLFNDDESSWLQSADDWLMAYNVMERKRSWAKRIVLRRNLPGRGWGYPRKHCQHSRCPGRDSNRIYPAFKPQVLLLRQLARWGLPQWGDRHTSVHTSENDDTTQHHMTKMRLVSHPVRSNWTDVWSTFQSFSTQVSILIFTLIKTVEYKARYGSGLHTLLQKSNTKPSAWTVHWEIPKLNLFFRFLHWILRYLYRPIFKNLHSWYVCRDSVVGLTTGYGLENRGVGVLELVGSKIFSTSSRPALGSTQPPIQWVPGPLSPRVKQPGREADHSPPTSAEVKKMWIYTFTSPYAFMP